MQAHDDANKLILDKFCSLPVASSFLFNQWFIPLIWILMDMIHDVIVVKQDKIEDYDTLLMDEI